MMMRLLQGKYEHDFFYLMLPMVAERKEKKRSFAQLSCPKKW